MRLKFERSPYKQLLEDDQFRLWIENLERGSVITASEYFKRIGHICDRFGITPSKLAEMDEKTAGNFLLQVVSHFEGRGCAGTYTKNYARTLRSWWSFNNIEVRKKIRIRGANESSKYENERVPMPEELEKILNVADIRAKVACTLVGFCGFRLEVLGDYLGDDGLKVADLPEMVIENGIVEFKKIPTMVIVRKRLSKAGHQFISFLPSQACGYLKQYLELRIRNGEQITTASPIITALEHNPHKVGQHIRTTNIGDLMRKAIRNAGFTWRPYVLRRYFDTRLMVAESDGLVIRDWRVFWMGHKGDIEHVYTVNKGLPEDVIEKMREAYTRSSEKCLVTIRKETMSQDKVLETFNHQFLVMAGYMEEEIKQFGDLSKLSVEQMQELIKKKSMEHLGLNGNSQKVVSMNEVKNWIEQGWEYVTSLPNDEAIVRLPTHNHTN